MHHHQQLRGEPKKKFKRRKDEKILHNVVSLRITDQEKRELDRITKTTCKSVSDVVREAIEFWLSKRKRLCLDA